MLTDAPESTLAGVCPIMICVSGVLLRVEFKVKQLSSSESCKYLSLGALSGVIYLTDLLFVSHNFAKCSIFAFSSRCAWWSVISNEFPCANKAFKSMVSRRAFFRNLRSGVLWIICISIYSSSFANSQSVAFVLSLR